MNNFLKVVGFILLPVLLTANGGPSDVSLIERTGNIQLVNKTNICLDAENLHIQIDGDYVNVQVNYTLTNNGPADTVTYAFPVDWYDEYGMISWQYSDGWEGECIPYFAMYSDGGELDIQIVDEEDSIICSKYFDGVFHEVYYQRRWYVAQLVLPANSSKDLMVIYRVKASYADFTTNKDYLIGYGSRTFSYTLSPSSNWSDGVVGEFSVTLDARDQLKKGMVIEDLDLPGITLEGDGFFYYHAEDFDLSGADDIFIAFDNSVPNSHEEMKSGRIGAGQLISITASSQGGDEYGVTNLIDGDPSTAWVEGVPGEGEGEWVEFEFTGFVPHVIGIVNGYAKNEEAFYRNNRVNEFEIEFFDESGTPIPGYRQSWDNLRDRDYADYNPNSPLAFVSFLELWAPQDQPSISSGRFRITIKSVYPGTDFDDACISELIIWQNPEND